MLELPEGIDPALAESLLALIANFGEERYRQGLREGKTSSTPSQTTTADLSDDDLIECLNLSDPLTSKLKREGLRTIGQLISTPDKYLLEIPRVGSVTLSSIDIALAKRGLKRGPFPPVTRLKIDRGLLARIRENDIEEIPYLERLLLDGLLDNAFDIDDRTAIQRAINEFRRQQQ